MLRWPLLSARPRGFPTAGRPCQGSLVLGREVWLFFAGGFRREGGSGLGRLGGPAEPCAQGERGLTLRSLSLEAMVGSASPLSPAPL